MALWLLVIELPHKNDRVRLLLIILEICDKLIEVVEETDDKE